MANASEAMTSGLRREGNVPAENKLWISTGFAGDGQVFIRVQDNGPGISPENLAKVREPLFTTKSFGTGLGIPAIEQIARQHGGRLDISSRPGEGACFEILLPLQQPENESANAA
jgi:signal transduction histidine kinase